MKSPADNSVQCQSVSGIAHDIPDRFCQTCGYNLRGLVGERCPECGEAFDPNQSAGANIPWLHRSAIGNWIAYWQTVQLVMVQPLQFSRQVWQAQRIDPNSAGVFMRITIAQATACFLITFAVLSLPNVSHSWNFYLIFLIASLFVYAITGLFFLTVAIDAAHLVWSEAGLADEWLWRQTVGRYACAPLALSPLACLCVMIGSRFDHEYALVGWIAPLIMAGWWWGASVLIMHVADRSLLSSCIRAVALPLLWIVLAVVMVMVSVAIAGTVATILAGSH